MHHHPTSAATTILLLLLTLSLFLLACSSGPPTKTLTATYQGGITISLDVPLDWEWDQDYNESESAEVIERDGDDYRAVKLVGVPPFGGYPRAYVVWWPGDVEEWLTIKADTAGEEGFSSKRWRGETDGHTTEFLQLDFTEVQALESYVMPDSDQWAWRIVCSVSKADEGQEGLCEGIVQSFKVEEGR